MSPTRLREIRTLATAFRGAFAVADRARLFITLRDFPRGACGDASLLVAHLLLEQGLGEFDYVLGRYGDASHAWLQQGALIVDITADQFPDAGQPEVIVALGSEWHSRLNGDIKHRATLPIYGQDWEATLLRDYRYLRSLAQITP